MAITNATFRFSGGGPLDGSEKLQSIPTEWNVVRYEHVPLNDSEVKHVYSGVKSPDQQIIELHYVGPSRTEGVKSED